MLVVALCGARRLPELPDLLLAARTLEVSNSQVTNLMKEKFGAELLIIIGRFYFLRRRFRLSGTDEQPARHEKT
jgi:hypothetical protein